MKILKAVTFSLIAGVSMVSVSCSGGMEGDNTEENGVEVLTTEKLIAEANEIGEEAFNKKYPADSEIELNGEASFPATWDDKIEVKFGPDRNSLPITAAFMFTDNGGTKEATDDKISSGEMLHFKGKVGMIFFDDKGQLSRLSISDCVVQ